ncbi:hypothetical protein SSPO_068620 [Streptomyces antimycoticus]|uniref:FAD-binding PCMH-type domain-containing protein n=1 Tax=Streptomyces antimycoticus TaxID=68175 RepID=A0A499UQF2_9ACTN|nr:hypothetical protein SSPO_068620 [Streptomyces antimycoticus]
MRGGGHSVAGMSLVDGGLVIDLRRMDGVTVDPGARTATVGGGAIMSGLDRATQPPSQHVLFPQGAAVAEGPFDYPLPWRGAAWIVHPFGLWDDPADDARVRQWAHDTRADVRPWSRGAVYLNFIGREGRDRVIEGFGAENYHRLAGVKALYDPDNVFRLNHNIEPRIEPRPAGR